MKKQHKARISQCMIVKNEEKNIEKALSWGKGFMWEQIVVDTGSSDRTVELAEAMGAKVFHFPWIDDFAAAKNHALKQASGDWIAFLDADEYVPDDMTDRVQPILTDLMNSPFQVLMCDLMNMDDGGRLFAGSTQLRFFRNSPEIRYVGKIHEGLSINGRRFRGREVLNVSEEFIIIHTGYARKAIHEKDKGERNRAILLKELEEQPEASYLLGYMGDCYDIEGNRDEAIKWFEKAVAVIPKIPVDCEGRDSQTFSTLLSLLSTEETEDRMMEIYEIATKRLPQDADMDFVAGIYFSGKNEYDKGIYHLERAIRLLEEYGYTFRAPRMSLNVGVAWERLAMCYYNKKQLDLCVNSCVRLLKMQPYILKTLMILLMAFRTDEERYKKEVLAAEDKGAVKPAATAVQVLAFLGGIYDLKSKKDRLFILKAAREGKCDDMVLAVKATFPAEEMEVLEQAMAQKWAARETAEEETTEEETMEKEE